MRRILLVSVLLAVGCGRALDGTCEETLTCPLGDGGGDVAADAGIDAPAGCELTKEPKDSLACVADSVGMFVDATKGDDAAGDGSKAKPMKTIGKALEKVGNKLRIYICEGTYAEDVVLDAAHDGVSVYGGWKCGDWTYSGGKPVVGKGTLALKIDSATKPIVLADLEIRSADAVTPGGSSIGVLVSNATDVGFTRDKVVAGNGLAGGNGVLLPFTYPDPPTVLRGKDATGNTGGAVNVVTCPGGATSTGAKGGDTGSDGNAGLPALGGGALGKAGPMTSQSCTAGGDGAAGTSAAIGDGAKVIGALSSSGWLPAKGADGPTGGPGQGGGGGGGQVSGGNSGGGGGGGAGACGGAGGPGGAGGGSSVALVTFSSKVTVAASDLTAVIGGNGGTGALAQGGQSNSGIGGLRGSGSLLGCLGGSGGKGGDGGSGGGGAGGISVGVLWKGTAAPTIDASTTAKTTVAAKGGSKGLGGATPTNDGIDGVAQAVLEVK